MKLDFYQQLEVSVLTRLCENGVHPDSSPGIAQNILNDIAIKFGGSVVYIKNRRQERDKEKHRRILADFNGSNHREVCQKYKISELWLKKLLKRAAENEVIE